MRSILNALQEGRLFELPDVGGKDRALGFLARILDANPDIEVGTDTIEEIKKRELEYNTGIGMGVGVPHVRARREEGELFCAIGWSGPGIDYGAADGEKVHLVLMYYIPGSQKNVYLKEISSLVKAMKKSGGIGPIAHAPDLNDVRNLLLDWVSSVLGESGPDAVARMIKLEVKHAQAPDAAPCAPVTVPAAAVAGIQPVIPAKKGTQVSTFTLICNNGAPVLVLSHDATLGTLLEKDTSSLQKLITDNAVSIQGYNCFLTQSTSFPNARFLHQGVALLPTGI